MSICVFIPSPSRQQEAEYKVSMGCVSWQAGYRQIADA
jgi:hypothetical protein